MRLISTALLAIEPITSEGLPVIAIDLISDALSHDADETRRLVNSDHVLQRSGKLTNQASEEDVPLERHSGLSHSFIRMAFQRCLLSPV